jgi:hypothetical protein
MIRLGCDIASHGRTNSRNGPNDEATGALSHRLMRFGRRGDAGMDECDRIFTCAFFQHAMAEMPTVGELIKRRYWHGDVTV